MTHSPKLITALASGIALIVSGTVSAAIKARSTESNAGIAEAVEKLRQDQNERFLSMERELGSMAQWMKDRERADLLNAMAAGRK